VDNVDGQIRFERMPEQKLLIDLQHLPLKFFAARLSPQGPWDSLSQISRGLSPHIPSSYLPKVWSPINVNGTGLRPKDNIGSLAVLMGSNVKEGFFKNTRNKIRGIRWKYRTASLNT
jgi:hypothetical protein